MVQQVDANFRKELTKEIFAGSAAAVFQTTISYPFEFLKTGLQLQRSLPGAAPFNMFYTVKTYFSGCSALNLAAIVKTTTRFTTFEQACKMMKDPSLPADAPLSGPRLLMAGTITGFMESMWVIPFENIKVIMIENGIMNSERSIKGTVSEKDKIEHPLENKKPTFHSMKTKPKVSPQEAAFLHYEKFPPSHFFPTIKEIYLTRGIQGFFKGAFPTILRQLGNTAIRFTVYTSLKQWISPNRSLNKYYAFGLGAVSSCFVVAVTQPIDVIKTRMQSKYSWMTYKNSLNCAYRIFVEEGFTKFWKGWLPRLFKVGLSGGLSFGVYQYTENLINSMQYEGYFQ
ncbi:ZYBA0S05-00826g1_1 [Zygosaccharomyces bailii CLIB 213]|uniref:ZYBA0S05-00826g1_1 n=1 Tax=Zygosaccharomyces bailii (strain CLIB 213 / ATCC 58445 / CBS 680 / BCRC 21525 / NBRC 1098 / NCYC 1416 / NRRL Y-2227) TaxID=1333698 RepID=A0A8J2T751_ZYGB2|nr:ZYBA0S05-00826g1_1 [Zygosaccharomyces bailii CLIB 213]